ncbi:MAG: hypothetical protein OSJ72_02785 [Lachnospiraceae bacterium]|nr:hypothetical protein [Lachnospiraceae bacterium]
MDRAEFMRRLSDLLQDVPPAEREEAIQYYNDYIDDAGEGNEAGIIASLGSPEELAKSIKAGLADGGNAGEFTESGFHGYEQQSKYQVMSTNHKQDDSQDSTQDYAQRNAQGAAAQSSFGADLNGQQSGAYGQQNGAGGTYGAYGSQSNAGQSAKPGSSMSGGQIALIAILAVLTSPIWIGLLGGLFGCMLGLLGVLLCLFIAFLVVGVVFLAVGVGLVWCGIVGIFGAPLAGFALVGVGLILMALGLVFTCLMVWTVGSAIPALIRGCVSLCNRIFHRGGVKA